MSGGRWAQIMQAFGVNLVCVEDGIDTYDIWQQKYSPTYPIIQARRGIKICRSQRTN